LDLCWSCADHWAFSSSDTVRLRILDLEKGVFQDGEWPDSWKAIEQRMMPRFPPDIGRRGSAPDFPFSDEGFVFEQVVRGMPPFPGPMRGPFEGRPFERSAFERVVFELDERYLRDVLLVELLPGHIDTGAFDIAILTRGRAAAVIYPADAEQARRIARSADASAFLFEPQSVQAMRLAGPEGPPEAARGRGRGPGPVAGRWQIFARHRAGSLEAVVSAARTGNLAVTGGVLLLLMASLAALLRYTRRSQRLAELQMDFVAGVSQELRTPLTVIHTAAYNLRGKLANDPVQVEKYGALIQRESGRLAEMVDEVMQFAGSAAGSIVLEREPVYVESLIEEALESSKAVMDSAGCTVEKAIDPELPPVLGDPSALKRVISNLLSNAAKHGAQGGGWIGVAAAKTGEKGSEAVEIRVADRGPGIPSDEQKQIFDPFFRGRRAVREQVHGSGLGLNLVKRIVEAHGGTIRIGSVPGKLTEFAVRLPALTEGRT
jgi:signal transduction histidine kinase